MLSVSVLFTLCIYCEEQAVLHITHGRFDQFGYFSEIGNIAWGIITIPLGCFYWTAAVKQSEEGRMPLGIKYLCEILQMRWISVVVNPRGPVFWPNAGRTNRLTPTEVTPCYSGCCRFNIRSSVRLEKMNLLQGEFHVCRKCVFCCGILCLHREPFFPQDFSRGSSLIPQGDMNLGHVLIFCISYHHN